MLDKIGYVNSIDYVGLAKRLSTMDKNQRNETFWANGIYHLQSNPELSEYKNKISSGSEIIVGGYYERSAEDCQKRTLKEITKLRKAENHYKELNQRFEIIYKDDKFVVFNYSSEDISILPVEFVEIELAKDYKSLTCSEITKMLYSGESKENQLMTQQDKSQNDCEIELTKYKNEFAIAEKKAKEELEEFRKKMYEQELALKQKQEAMLSELHKKVDEMKDKIFILEMNIFALRSYFGETFSLTQLVKGKNAPEKSPLIIYQKFRYMDEDLTRLMANSEFSTKDTSIIKMFKENTDILLDTFCPNEKCITFFRTSKDNKLYSYDYEGDCIKEFEYFHGKQIGMLIRNGENLYISFIDEEITLKDNLFISNSVSSQEQAITQDSKIRSAEVRTVFNRRQIFIILQALLKNSNIFENLKEENVLNSSKIVLSNIDGQIRYDKYPSIKQFAINNSGNKIEIKQDDTIFIYGKHAGSKTEQNYWGNGYHEEHRGVGYRNTGRDAIINEGVSKISKVNSSENGYWVYYTLENGANVYKHIYSLDDELVKAGNTYKPRIDKEYYVSCKRNIEEWQRSRRWDGSLAKVNNTNLRIWEDEFMSIMWLNSNYVTQWIDNKEGFDGKNFVYFCKLLKDLREYLIKRETEEFNNINKLFEFQYNPKNNDILLEFKIKYRIRNLTETRIKKFNKYLEEL